MERRREQRSERDVWPDHYRLSRVSLTRVRPRAPMTRSEQRLTLVIWIISIYIALLSLATLLELLADLIRAIGSAL